jgi:hypothetical protein
VALFFMITGFLFWLRVLRAGSAFDTRAFFVSRLRRLTPMYAMSVLMVLAVVAAASGFTLQVSPVTLARELRPWLSFGFMDTGSINGMREARYINAVYWTLAYEWMFYLMLPLLALFARGWAAAALAAAVLVFGTQEPIVFNFLFGALAATIVHRRLLGARLASPLLTALPLCALGAYFVMPGLYGFAQSVALSASSSSWCTARACSACCARAAPRCSAPSATASTSRIASRSSLRCTRSTGSRRCARSTARPTGCSRRSPPPAACCCPPSPIATSSIRSCIPNLPASLSGRTPRR